MQSNPNAIIILVPLHVTKTLCTKCYVTQLGVGGCEISLKKRYQVVWFNLTRVTKGGCVDVKFPEKLLCNI